MPTGRDEADDELTLFLDGDDLYVRGPADSVDAALAELLAPREDSPGELSLGAVTTGVEVASTFAAAGATTEQLLRPTAESLQKLHELGAQLDGSGALRGYVRSDAGKFAGNLSFEAVSFGAEQALMMQTAAVSLALRTAIAEVGAAVEAVDEKVSDIQRRLRSEEIGEVVGTYRFLLRVANRTKERGALLDPDWDAASGAQRDLYVALERLRSYVTDSINDISAEDSLPKRQKAIERISDPKHVAGSLQLILVAEQALHLMEYLRIERVRARHPDQLQSELDDARKALREQREKDAELARSATEAIHAAKEIAPLEIRHVLGISSMRRTAGEALDVIESFAHSSRADLPEVNREVRRPALSEAGAEIRRIAVDTRRDVAGASRAVGKLGADTARQVAARARRKASDEAGGDAAIPQPPDG